MEESASGLLCLHLGVCVCVCVYFGSRFTASYLSLFTLPPSQPPLSKCETAMVKVCVWVGQCCDVSMVSVLRCAILSVQLCMTGGAGGVCVCVLGLRGRFRMTDML